MKTFTFSIPTLGDAKAKFNTTISDAKVRAEARKAKREARRIINAERDQKLVDLAAEIIKGRS